MQTTVNYDPFNLVTITLHILPQLARNLNTSFDSISNGNGGVKRVIAFLKQPLSSKDANDDHDDEGGVRRSSSPNKSQPNSTSYSPTNDQSRPTTFRILFALTLQDSARSSLGVTVHDLFSFSAPSPQGPGHGPSANTMEESDTRTEGEETINLPLQARLLPYQPLLMPVNTSGSRSPFVSTGSPFAPASMDAVGLYELGYRHAPLPLSSLPWDLRFHTAILILQF